MGRPRSAPLPEISHRLENLKSGLLADDREPDRREGALGLAPEGGERRRGAGSFRLVFALAFRLVFAEIFPVVLTEPCVI